MTNSKSTGKGDGLTQAELKTLERLYDVVLGGDLYVILGVARGADPSHIRKAYYDLSRSWHPDGFYRRDLGPWKDRLEEVFAAINHAYAVLSDSARRDQWDEDHPVERPAPAVPLTRDLEDHFVLPDPKEAVEYEVHLPREPGRKPERPRRNIGRHLPGMKALRAQALERLKKARRYHKMALQEAAKNNWRNAAANINLAMRLDSKCEDYKRLWDEYDPKARTQVAEQFMSMADNAMSIQDIKSATEFYSKACEADPPIGEPFHQLAMLWLQGDEEADSREVMRYLRTAVERAPTNIDYRLTLARFAAQQGLKVSARREYEAVLRQQPEHEAARAELRKVRS